MVTALSIKCLGPVLLATKDPSTTRIGAASPIARPIARIAPVMIPGIAAGRQMFLTVCQRVAPRPREASLSDGETARSASWEAMMMIGKMTNASV